MRSDRALKKQSPNSKLNCVGRKRDRDARLSSIGDDCWRRSGFGLRTGGRGVGLRVFGLCVWVGRGVVIEEGVGTGAGGGARNLASWVE